MSDVVTLVYTTKFVALNLRGEASQLIVATARYAMYVEQ